MRRVAERSNQSGPVIRLFGGISLLVSANDLEAILDFPTYGLLRTRWQASVECKVLIRNDRARRVIRKQDARVLISHIRSMPLQGGGVRSARIASQKPTSNRSGGPNGARSIKRPQRTPLGMTSIRDAIRSALERHNPRHVDPDAPAGPRPAQNIARPTRSDVPSGTRNISGA
jgi:hypothetical protein